LQHSLDELTGQYIKKLEPSIPATTFNEKDVEYILPVMTKPFSFQENKTTLASWNEHIIINSDYINMLQPNTIAFFEILDFGTQGTSKTYLFPTSFNQ
jgi:jouberin